MTHSNLPSKIMPGNTVAALRIASLVKERGSAQHEPLLAQPQNQWHCLQRVMRDSRQGQKPGGKEKLKKQN